METQEHDNQDIGGLIEQAARVAHEVNRAYCKGLGDDSHLPWDMAPDWQRESAMAGVRQILANPSTTPRESHENWFSHKQTEGWVYGPVKDPSKKTHPCMVAYDKLPAEQRVKDELFGASVRSTLFGHGLLDNRPESSPSPIKMTPDYIEGLCGEVTYYRHGTLTMCVLELKNGAMITGKSNVISPANFNEELGRQIALKNAKEKIWQLEGYALKTRGR